MEPKQDAPPEKTDAPGAKPADAPPKESPPAKSDKKETPQLAADAFAAMDRRVTTLEERPAVVQAASGGGFVLLLVVSTVAAVIVAVGTYLLHRFTKRKAEPTP